MSSVVRRLKYAECGTTFFTWVRPVTRGIILYAMVYFLQGFVYRCHGEWLYLPQWVLVVMHAYCSAMFLIDRDGLRQICSDWLNFWNALYI
jgi:hypothetical protein